MPDETTILRFRRLLEQHGLQKQIFELVRHLLQTQGLMLQSGTTVDATLIAAPSSTKNKSGQRDPDMHSSRKGKQWNFGMKAHIGTDTESGLVHSLVGTSGHVHDVTQVGKGLIYAYGQGVSKNPDTAPKNGSAESVTMAFKKHMMRIVN